MKPIASVLILTLFLISACSSSENKKLTDSEKAQLYIESATTALNEGDSTSAMSYLQEAKKLKKSGFEIEYLLSMGFYQKGELDQAIASGKKAVQLNPEFSPAKNALGRFYLEKGNLAAAEPLLKDAASDLTYRDAFLAKTNLGVLYGKKKNLAESERWYSKAILDAGNAACMASFYRGELFLSKNELEKAYSDFKQSSKYNCTGFTDAHLALGKTLMLMKKNEQARAKFVEIQKLFPSTEAAKKANQYLKEIQ
jgi:type IV pilus assembly protein PilF